MALHGLKWNFFLANTHYFKSSHIHTGMKLWLSLNRTSVGSVSLTHTCKCRSFVAFRGYYAATYVSCASHTKKVFWAMSPTQYVFYPDFPQHVSSACSLSVKEPVTWKLFFICKLFSCAFGNLCPNLTQCSTRNTQRDCRWLAETSEPLS